MYSAALCRGLIEAVRRRAPSPGRRACIPRLYAAASLKPVRRDDGVQRRREYSAALCRGLIEAPAEAGRRPLGADVFRGFMPRPH